MPGIRIVGADGSLTISNEDLDTMGAFLRTWTLNLPRPVSNVTAFAGGQIASRTGLPDISGTIAGVADSANAPGAFLNLGTDVTLRLGMLSTSNSYLIEAQISNFTIGSDKTADAPLSWDFVGGVGASSEVWV